MLASLVRALFRASSSQCTKAVDGDVAKNLTTTIADHEVEQQDAPAGRLEAQNKPEDFLRHRESLKANIYAWE